MKRQAEGGARARGEIDFLDLALHRADEKEKSDGAPVNGTPAINTAIFMACLLVFWGLSSLPIFASAPIFADLILPTLMAVIGALVSHRIAGSRRRRPEIPDLSSILDNIPGLIAVADNDGKLTYANRWHQDYYGTAASSVTGSGWLGMIHPEERDDVARQWKRCLRDIQPLDVIHRLRRHDGEYCWFRARVQPALDKKGRATNWYGLITDIDDQKRAELKLAAEETQLEQLISVIPALVWSAAADGTVEFLNRRWLEYTGISRGEALGWGWVAAIHPDDRDDLALYWKSLLASGRSGQTEARIRGHNGQFRWFLFRAEPVRDVAGATVRWFGSNTDIDDLKNTEATLRARERELQFQVDAIPTLVWCMAPDGRLEYINKQMSLYCYGHTDGIDQKNDAGDIPPLNGVLTDLMHRDDTSEVLSKMAHSLKTGEPFAMRYRTRRFDGAYRWVNARAEALRDAKGQIVKWYGVSVDIDDEIKGQEKLRAAQQELARASQIASLAELSASIAHESNQPLASLVINSYALQRWLTKDSLNLPRIKTIAERIVREADAACEVVSRVRALFNQGNSIRDWINIHATVDEVFQLIIGDMEKNNIDFTIDLGADLPAVFADKVQIQQVLTNLLRNGIDAVKFNTCRPRSLILAARTDENSSLIIEVCDNGAGIVDLERIFESFFTTKPNGMGMGLSICRSIVEAHGGALSARNLHPTGAAFSFFLPIA